SFFPNSLSRRRLLVNSCSSLLHFSKFMKTLLDSIFFFCARDYLEYWTNWDNPFEKECKSIADSSFLVLL
ncbi:unnamed protein product, partial (mitochondrion) [Musa textilis]